jgi:predicted transcriptional regulator
VARLGELERKVMEVLWSSMDEPMSGRQVADQLPDRAYTTVLTILDRLRRKHLVSRVAVGRAHLFSATASRSSFIAELMVEALGGAKDRGAALVRFAEVMSAEEALLLREALDRVDQPEELKDR